MAHHQSTIKRIRQTAKRTERNRYYRTRVKTITKNKMVEITVKTIFGKKVFKIKNKSRDLNF